MRRVRPLRLATSSSFSAADHVPIPSHCVLESIPVHLKPSSSAFRKPSFYIPRMRECVEDTEFTGKIIRADGLGSALPIFGITSSCDYYALRLPLLKAGFKRLSAPQAGVPCNLMWGRPMSLHPLGMAASASSPRAISDVLGAGGSLPPQLRDRMSLAEKDFSWAVLMLTKNSCQRFNHFPFSHQFLGCKRGMAANLRRVQLHIEKLKGGHSERQGEVTEESVQHTRSGSHSPLLPADMYDFVPRTWAYPQAKEDLLKMFHSTSSSESFIWKPARGSCGRGIYITQGGSQNAASWERVIEEIDRKASSDQPGSRIYRQYVVQKYIDNPLLLNGKKMDLRLYVAVTSYDPLTVYLHDEGLVRLAAECYSTGDGPLPSYQDARRHSDEAMLNLEDSGLQGECADPQFRNPFRHLTNYSIGRKYPILRQHLQAGSIPQQQLHPGGIEGDATTPTTLESGDGREGELTGIDVPAPELKWSLQRLWNYLDCEYATTDAQTGGSSLPMPSERLKEEISLVITRVLMSVKPRISQAICEQLNTTTSAPGLPTPTGHGGFFELYGFDIMLDEKLNPKLIEVNTMPSLESSSVFDYAVKSNVVADLLNLSMMEAFERPLEALTPFLKNPENVQLPDAAVRPYIHTLDKLLQMQGDQTPQISSAIEREELISKLADEMQYARGFKRIFPPVSARELVGQGVSSSSYPVHATSCRAKKDLEAYSSLGLLSRRDECVLQAL